MAPKAAQHTAEDYRALPEEGPRYQLIQGELRIMSPSPNRYHQEILVNLAWMLRAHLERHPIGKVYVAPFDVFLTEHDVYQPDILFLANPRLGLLSEEGARGAPTLVIEILSPGTERLDRTVKREIYAATGVEELWLVDPEPRRIEVYRLQEDASRPAAVNQEQDEFRSVCIPGLAISCARVFKE